MRRRQIAEAVSFLGLLQFSGSFGNGRFLRQIKSVPRLRIPVLCDAHARLFRVTSVFTK